MPNFGVINGNVINGLDRMEYGSGSMFPITQIVSFSESGSGSMCAITQVVSNSGAGSMCSIVQVVSAPVTFYTRNGWYPHLYINGHRVADNLIHGPIVVKRVENDAASMDFVLIPARGAIDLAAYEGKSVILNIQTATGLHRVYTGKVNIPDLDLNERKLSISCTDSRRELINQNYVGVVNNIGYYSQNIFGISKDKAQELDYRLTTTPKTLNFNPYGVPVVTSSFAAATPHYTFTEGDVYRDNGRDPHVILTPRSKVVNTVNINYEYRYSRLYFTGCRYEWSIDIDCDYLTKGYSQTKRDVISAAANSAGWPLYAPITFDTNFDSGWYSCNGTSVGFNWIETGYINVAQTQTIRDGSGALITTNVVDSAGNQVYNAVATSYINHQQEFCDSATWFSYFRWAQNVSETYTLTVAAPTSVTRFGEVSQDDSAGLSSVYDVKQWENLSAPTPAIRGTAVYGTGTGFYWNDVSSQSTYNNDLNVLLNRAKTTILKSHRENRVIFNTFLKPELDLRHTVLLETESFEGTDVTAKGKVYAITHTMDPREGDCNTQIELALSVSAGSSSDDALSLPTRPTNNLTHNGYSIILGSHYGEDPTNHPEWNGFIGNKWITEYSGGGSNTFRTQYPESFVVDTPAIEGAYRDNVSLTASASYDVDIIDDDLDIIL